MESGNEIRRGHEINMTGSKIGVGIYGGNGHQVHTLLEKSEMGALVAAAAFPAANLPKTGGKAAPAPYATLDELLADPVVDLVSLCSPRRRDQAADAIRCLRAGKHVYAEKPCAMEESDLDLILRAAQETGCAFHEMAGTAFGQPYYAMRGIVRAGTIGEIIQVTAEKSYPYHEDRPQDEDIDGGLIAQNAIHALRFIEHVAGVEIRSVHAAETTAGNPVPHGGLRMAAALLLTLENGGVASVTANYLNPRGTGVWGYETLRLFGTLGMIESLAGGRQTRLVVGEKDWGAIDATHPGIDYFEAYLRSLAGGAKMPLSLEEELSPTRWAIRARNAVISKSVSGNPASS
jgi:predicted dehydrogenase